MKQLCVLLAALMSVFSCINIFAEDGRRLCLAAQDGNWALVSGELARGADVNYVLPYSGWTALQYAAKYCELTAVCQLLLKGANTNLPNQYDQTPLHLAASGGSAAIAVKLISAGADVHAVDRFGDTPLHKAAFNNHYTVVQILLGAGARVDARNRSGHTPLHRASLYTYDSEVVRLLLDAGADREAIDRAGKKPALQESGSVALEGEGSVHSLFCALGWCR
ncbi:ankyrin repeat domain-containing protein [Candidatus Babeliales bacterium]|nr:ankyrin repeat domain-containing protein [Candidatus Babeliales bacterium]